MIACCMRDEGQTAQDVSYVTLVPHSIWNKKACVCFSLTVRLGSTISGARLIPSEAQGEEKGSCFSTSSAAWHATFLKFYFGDVQQFEHIASFSWSSTFLQKWISMQFSFIIVISFLCSTPWAHAFEEPAPALAFTSRSPFSKLCSGNGGHNWRTKAKNVPATWSLKSLKVGFFNCYS